METFAGFIIIAFIIMIGIVVKETISPSPKKRIRSKSQGADNSAGSVGFFGSDNNSDCHGGGSWGGGDSGGSCGGGGGD
ncbi:hypothetical protein [Bacillus sp. CGMCC 1.16541]|uniref:hypothetical protein n=1 Tax=Bacillus sp. CGMCC 1.16541 TaxID=2185143 RepID=UPI000D73F312|nr:hypothetical protein [Bacillus sp. CGMCC 1.16541]